VAAAARRYLHFLFDNPRFLAFGLLLTAASSFGQTFCIALFGGDLRSAFGLSNGGFGAVYTTATLASAACLPWLGRQLDHMDLRVYASAVSLALAGSVLLLGAAGGLITLWLAVFGLRLCGQGLMGHTAVTSMARYFRERRGVAISIAASGHALGEAALPALALLTAAAFGWRGAWSIFAGALALVLVPAIFVLLRGHGERHARYLAEVGRPGEMLAAGGTVGWSATRLLRDPAFRLVLPMVLTPACLATGFLFHQVPLAEAKGWPLELLARAFVGYAAGAVAGSLLTGVLIDRFGARRLLPFYLLPFAGALVAVALADRPAVAFLFLAGTGLTAGASGIVLGALWAELYGTRELGAIRSVASALMVFASGLSPFLFGWLIDQGASPETIALGSTVWIGAVLLRLRVGQAVLTPSPAT
jgi:MFS family permease